MDIQVTEFELKFSAAITNLTTMIANYADAVNTQVRELNSVVETLKAENKKLTENQKEGEKVAALEKSISVPVERPVARAAESPEN